MPLSADISRTGSSRLRRGPSPARRTMGAVLRCGESSSCSAGSTPLRHHVDRSALLLQLRTGSVMAEADARPRAARRRSRAARAVVFRERGRHVLAGVVILGLRRASWSDPWGLTISQVRLRHVMLANVWRVIWPIQKIVIANRWPSRAAARRIRGGGSRAARVSRVPHQRRVVVPHAVLYGSPSHFTLPPAEPRLWP